LSGQGSLSAADAALPAAPHKAGAIFSLNPFAVNVKAFSSSPNSISLAPLPSPPSAKMPAVKRRTLLQALPAATLFRTLFRTLFPASLWAAPQPDQANPAAAATAVYELRVYHAAPGKLGELHSRFREHTIKIFDRHGMKSVAYWTPLDEPEKSNTLIYILQHPSREAAAANWKSFGDDPEWKSVRDKSEANGKLVEKVDSTFMALTDFSPRL